MYGHASWQHTRGVKSVPLRSLVEYEVLWQLTSARTQQCYCRGGHIPSSRSLHKHSVFPVVFLDWSRLDPVLFMALELLLSPPSKVIFSCFGENRISLQ